ncbi:MAG: ribosome biogenesis GTPase Der [Proteobacteria bacterium]|nr:ribosome biogenesis GTPase Der [Pseudomonadota bacterium]
MSHYYGKVSLIGRVNVGKSKLFNRLTAQRRMIVSHEPGATRDRVYGTCRMGLGEWSVIDSGGYETHDFSYQPFGEELVWQQTEKALEESDLALLIMDGRHGFHVFDGELAQMLHRSSKPVMYVVNKVDDIRLADKYLSDFYNHLHQAEKIWPVSAASAAGLKVLVTEVEHVLSSIQKPKKSTESEQPAPAIALIGRPNSGKSSLLNRLSSSQRSCVSDVAGTTRDLIDVATTYNYQNYTLVDTAGVRRRTKVDEGLERISVTLSIKAINQSDVCVLVIDAIQGFTDQDAKLVRLVMTAQKPLLVVINKWDLISDKSSNTLKHYEDNLRRHHLASMSFVPIRAVSALKNQRVHELFTIIETLVNMSSKRIPTAIVNRELMKITQARMPHLIKSFQKRVKFYYATQVSIKPPTFLIKCNVAHAIKDSYKSYIKASLQKALPFHLVTIRLIFRDKQEENEQQNASRSTLQTHKHKNA